MGVLVTNIQRFSVHDGPGIRTTIFFKGCPLDCIWCHNPETKRATNQILYNERLCISCGSCRDACPNGAHIINHDSKHLFDVTKCKGYMECTKACPTKAIEPAGKSYTLEQILDEVKKDIAFYSKDGGITLSGGEPLMHMKECLWLLRKAKETGISTAIETCGYFDNSYIEQLAGVVDWFLWDYKDTDTIRHYKYTGMGNKKIIKNLFLLDKFDTSIILRCIIVNGLNTDDRHIDGISDIYHRLRSCKGVELIPYHSYGGGKNKALGYDDNGNKNWIPSQELLSDIKIKLSNNGVTLV
jgi:glycyl-radical enzyme activating protein